MTRRSFLSLLPALLLAHPAICLPTYPDFSGTWKQSNERCVPPRKGDVTLRIDHHNPDLIVETTVIRSSGPPQHAVQRYSTDGKTSVSTGADGDEFHTSVTWNGSSLLFAIEEHEDGRILLSKETWTVQDHGSVLQRVRERAGGEMQTLVYIR